MPNKAQELKARFAAAGDIRPSVQRTAPTRIDDEAIERLTNDARSSVWLSDNDPTATGFRVRKQGQRLTFNFVARNPDGKMVNVLIGQVGVIPLKEARERAREMRRQIADGLCPSLEKEAQAKRQKAKRTGQREAREWTVRRAIQAKLDDPSLREGSKDNYRSLLSVALKKLAKRRLDDIGRAEWKRLLDKIKRDVSAAQAAKVRAMAAAIYRTARAESENLALENPLADLVVKLDDGSGQRRQGRLEEDDLHGWVKKLRTLDNDTAMNLALFTLMTAMREAEARLLQWNEIRGDEIIIPAERIKVRKPLRLPITNAMWKVLEKQKGKSKKWVFPSRRSRDKPISPILPQMKQLGTTVHDLRRTALSIIDDMGVPSGVRRAIANHAPASIADGYVVAAPEDVRAALAQFHERLDTAIYYGAYFEGRPQAPRKAAKGDAPPTYWDTL